MTGALRPFIAEQIEGFSVYAITQDFIIRQNAKVEKISMLSEDRSFSAYQIALHWGVAALVIFQLLFGESMTTVVDAADSGSPVSHSDHTLASSHYWIGILILVLVAARAVLRLKSGAPVPAGSGPRWMTATARISHGLFYILLVTSPILGLLAFYVGDPFGDIHSLNRPVFIVLIALHVGAALLHQFWFKDGTLKRMLMPSR
jgi:cytochrome b561